MIILIDKKTRLSIVTPLDNMGGDFRQVHPWLSGHRHSLNIKELQTKYKLISGRKLSYIGVGRQASGAGYEN